MVLRDASASKKGEIERNKKIMDKRPDLTI